jgi:hypothetical protein
MRLAHPRQATRDPGRDAGRRNQCALFEADARPFTGEDPVRCPNEANSPFVIKGRKARPAVRLALDRPFEPRFATSPPPSDRA